MAITYSVISRFAAIVLSTALILPSSALAQAPTDTAVAPAPSNLPSRHELAGLEAFLDGLVRAQQRTPGTAGIVIGVVDRDGVRLSKGWGIAKQPDVAVSPRDSLFRIGSISKTFTYLAALQLIEEGKLSLDEDINRYLPEDLRIPNQGFAPIKVRHLLTHTAGFEDLALGHLFVDAPERVLSLTDYLRQHRPARVRPPGQYAVYSNYSVALLGHLIELRSGRDFDAYVESLLFKPMGMSRTTFREPLTAKDPRDLQGPLRQAFPQGFNRGIGSYIEQGPEYIAQVGPAGGVSSTADDMNRYMRMLLNRGVLDGRRVLSEAVVAKIEQPLFRNAPEVGSLNHGFIAMPLGKLQATGHGGATLQFHSNMVLVPELGIGIFVSTNTDNSRPFAESLPALVLEKYFPQARSAAPAADAKLAGQASEIAGEYRAARRAYYGLEGFVGLFQSQRTISADTNGDLIVSGGAQPSRWRAIGKDVYAEIEGAGRLRALRDDSGKVTVISAGYGVSVNQRIGFLQSNLALYLALGATFVLSLLCLRSAWRARRSQTRRSQRSSAARWITFSAVVWLLFLLVLGFALSSMLSAGNAVLYHFPSTSLIVAQWLARAASVCALIGLVSLWGLLRHREIPASRRLLLSLTVLAMSACAWLLWQAQLTAF